jgi:uncharacterized membrane protein
MKKNKYKSYDKTKSRKWNLVLLVFWVSSLAFLIPPLLSIFIFKAEIPLVILSGIEFISLNTLVVSAYFGANVTQHHIELKNIPNNRCFNKEKIEIKSEEEENDDNKEA